MRHALLSLLLAPLAAPSAPQEAAAARPRVELREGLVLEVARREHTESGLRSFRTLQGQDTIAKLNTDEAQRTIEDRELRFRDAFGPWGGAEHRVERRFEELRQRVRAPDEVERRSPLVGRSLSFTGEGPGAPAEASLAPPEEGAAGVPPRALEGHRMPYPALLLLPGGEVRPGEEWPLDEASARGFLGLHEHPGYFDDGSRPPDPLQELLREHATFRGTVRYEGLAPAPASEGEEPGPPCWVLAHELSFEVDRDSFDPRAMGVPVPPEAEGLPLHVHASGGGKLWIDAERRLPVARSFTLDADLSMGYGRSYLRTEIELFVHREEEERWEVR